LRGLEARDAALDFLSLGREAVLAFGHACLSLRRLKVSPIPHADVVVIGARLRRSAAKTSRLHRNFRAGSAAMSAVDKIRAVLVARMSCRYPNRKIEEHHGKGRYDQDR
jgi:hypothetical protein